MPRCVALSQLGESNAGQITFLICGIYVDTSKLC